MSFLRACTCTVKTHYPSQKPTHNPSLSHTYVHHQSSHKNFTLNKNVTDIHMQYVPIRSFGLKMTFSTSKPFLYVLFTVIKIFCIQLEKSFWKKKVLLP